MRSMVFIFLVLSLSWPIFSETKKEELLIPPFLETVKIENPNPEELPTLSLEQKGIPPTSVYVSFNFPDVPGLVCDAWCYEDVSWGVHVELIGVRKLGGGKIELVHRVLDCPQFLHITAVNPMKGAVEFVGRFERDTSETLRADSPSVELTLPPGICSPEICWGLKRGPNFQSDPPDLPRATAERAKHYYENFIKRCFLFTDEGRVFMDKTPRGEIATVNKFRLDDPRNNPPNTQQYRGVWQQPVEPGTPVWSPTRYTFPLMGVVSRDGKWLTAMASNEPAFLSQAWLDCGHLCALWEPDSAPPEQRTWRRKVYAMKNDPQALLDLAYRDFPGAARLKDKRVPQKD